MQWLLKKKCIESEKTFLIIIKVKLFQTHHLPVVGVFYRIVYSLKGDPKFLCRIFPLQICAKKHFCKNALLNRQIVYEQRATEMG